MIIVKYNKKTKDIKCKCGGDVWIDGQGSYEHPVGFGNLGEVDKKLQGKFGFTKLRFTGWIGQCEVCKKQVMAWVSRKIVNKEISTEKL